MDNLKDIVGNNLILRPLSLNDMSFLDGLFGVEDIDLYFVRRSEHKNDMASFVANIINSKNEAMFVINSNGVDVGIINFSIVIEDREPFLEIGYAVMPSHREQGIAKRSLNMMMSYLRKTFRIKEAYLKIALSNVPSIAVAESCDFELRDSNGYMDPVHPELGFQKKWYKTLLVDSERSRLFNIAISLYQKKQYLESSQLYQQALKAPEDGQFTDLQIMSNMGLAMSGAGLYSDAKKVLLMCYMKGNHSQSIISEIQWLESHGY